MIIFNDTVAMGDTLCTFPIVMAIPQQIQEPGRIYWTNGAVGALVALRGLRSRPIAGAGGTIPGRAHDPNQPSRLHLEGEMVDRSQQMKASRRPSLAGSVSHQIHATARISYPWDPTVPSYDFVLARAS